MRGTENLLKDVHVVAVELKVEELGVGLDTVLGQGLGEDDVAMSETPLEQDLSRGLAVLGCDSLDLGAVESLTLSHGCCSPNS